MHPSGSESVSESVSDEPRYRAAIAAKKINITQNKKIKKNYISRLGILVIFFFHFFIFSTKKNLFKIIFSKKMFS